jgi:hypothetical protein
VVVADTSVWIEYLQGGQKAARAALRGLIRSEQVALVGVVLAELLQGCRSPQEREMILATLAGLPFLDARLSTWQRAGDLSASLLRQGLTIPLTDLIIAALALEHGCQLFTLDPHFDHIPELSLFRIPKGRSTPR